MTPIVGGLSRCGSAGPFPYGLVTLDFVTVDFVTVDFVTVDRETGRTRDRRRAESSARRPRRGRPGRPCPRPRNADPQRPSTAATLAVAPHHHVRCPGPAAACGPP